MSDARKDIREAAGHTTYGIRKFILPLVLLFAIITGLGFLTQGLGLWRADIDRAVTKRTHQYIETVQSQLLKLNKDFRRLEVEIAEAKDPAVKQTKIAQRNATLAEMKMQATRIPKREIPAAVALTLAQNPS